MDSMQSNSPGVLTDQCMTCNGSLVIDSSKELAALVEAEACRAVSAWPKCCTPRVLHGTRPSFSDTSASICIDHNLLLLLKKGGRKRERERASEPQLTNEPFQETAKPVSRKVLHLRPDACQPYACKISRNTDQRQSSGTFSGPVWNLA